MERRFDVVTVVVCDSVGCGDAPDAADFGDLGSNTLGHVVERTGVDLPHLTALGLGRLPHVPLPAVESPAAAHGRMTEVSAGKDTTSGHWELMGLVSEKRLPTFPEGFPAELIEAFEGRIGRPTLGNRPASGTRIIQELGDEHVATGAPIVYTSADSVFQVAAHEEVIPVDELMRICRTARRLLTGPLGVGRVIARPFVGGGAGEYERTARRRDFSLPPHGATALDRILEAGLTTHGVGKIHDIFAGRGLASHEKTVDDADGVEKTRAAVLARRADLIFTNLIDFDSRFGHRRDVEGYARALSRFDAAVPELLDALGPRDLLLITADHGNDPTWEGTDHTRERVPLLVAGDGIRAAELGTRQSFADVAATVSAGLGVRWEGPGESFVETLRQPA